ncbi:hypothetical protein Sste5346_008597 [Sporothrix stenoceras]|uniref:Zn(2)-C6 fungal-type domain-containing protein n=1 Tax=Sporothrix stenoceras TaxID=5173 RepID=A0ABR3YPP5_9PEZI
MPLGSVSPRSAATGVGNAFSGSAAGDDRAKATAKWGAACASCAAAKAKCIRTNEEPGSKCDRCERLFKDCTDQIHRPRKKRASKPSKTAQLEERLNGLVDLLRASGELPTNVANAAAAAGVSIPTGRATSSTADRPESTSTDSPTNAASVRSGSAPSGPSTNPSPPDTRDSRDVRNIHNIRDDYPDQDARDREPRDVRRETVPNTTPATIPSTYNSFAPPSCICRPEIGDTITDAVESDETLLQKYLTHMQPLAPIVVLPKSVTAAQLAVDRPFLFLAIRTVASVDNYRSMQGLMYQLINHVADYMLLRAERSLDLVQGLLTIMSWYHHHCMMHAQLGNLLHLASSLVADLNLARPARLAERTDLMVLHPNPPSPRTHEERRVLLGLWYIRSCVALCFQKTEPMRFTPYIRQCMHELEEAKEVPSDAVLVAMVRMQLLAEKMGAFNSREESADDDIPHYPRAPKAAYKIAFRSELDQMVASFSADVKKHVIIESHVCAITLRLYEPPLLDLPLLRKLSTSLTSASSPMMATALDMLYSARTALNGFFDHFFSISIHIYQYLPIPLYVHLIYGITMLSRWARLIGPTRPANANNNAANLRGPAFANKDASAGNTPVTSSTESGTGTSAANNGASSSFVSTPDLDLRDPSHRLVPGQGAAATKPGLGGLGGGPVTSIPFQFIPGMDARELQRDPSLLKAVARLREHMRQQPDLQLDIPATLATIWDKFEQSNREMRASGAAKFGDSVGRGMNVWDLTARKIAIMRFKVGRYLDGATTGAIGGANDSAGGSGGAGGTGAGGDAGTARDSNTTNVANNTTSNTAAPPDQQRQPPAFYSYLPYAQQMFIPGSGYSQQSQTSSQTETPASHQQQQQQHQQQLPIHTAHTAHTGMTFGTTVTGGTPSQAQQTPAGTSSTGGPPPMPLNGLPPDMAGYAMGGSGVPGGVGAGLGVADISFGLGNLEGWENDPLWGADLFGTGPDPAMWAENMDWVATLG